MRVLLCLWVALVLATSCVAEQCEKTCVFTDVDCMTSGSKFVYKNLFSDDHGSIPLDPLQIEKIEKNRGSTKYTLTNIKLIGLRSCEVTQLGIIVNETIYKHYVHCPKLTSTFDYEAKDASQKKSFREKGYKIAADNYEILNQGLYTIVIGEKDHLPHAYVESVKPMVDLKGDVTFDIKHLCAKDKQKSHEAQGCINHNKKTTAIYLNSLIVKKAMRIMMMIRIQDFIRQNTLSQTFPANGHRKPACGSLEFILEETFSHKT